MLKQWLKREGMTLTAFGKQIGLSKGYLSTLNKERERTPSLEVAFAIEAATKGGVPARYWYERARGMAA